MAHLVLVSKTESIYDDLPEIRYHFPKRYLSTATTGIGDLIVYYEPRRTTPYLERGGGRQMYFATARITRIEKDEAKPDHYYAYMSEYIPFDRPVSLREGGRIYEPRLRNPDGTLNMGLIRWAVRALEPSAFQAILDAGFASPPTQVELDEFDLEPETIARPLVEAIVRRPFRNVMFRRLVRRAYGGKCAMTGLRIENDLGGLEVEAAHIRPVEKKHSGSDSVRNGIALTRTIHWLFDEGFVSVEDDLRILLAKRGIPDKVRSILNKDGQLQVPRQVSDQPHRQFLRYHREKIFLG